MKIADFKDYVGREVGVSRWFPIEQGRVNSFADLTEDWQSIHVDAASAASSPFGTTIAHGFLVMSLLSAMLNDALPAFEDRGVVLNYGFDKLRFLSPVRTGSRVRARITLLESQPRNPGSYLNKFNVTVEVDNESKPALVAEWLILERPAGEPQEQSNVSRHHSI